MAGRGTVARWLAVPPIWPAVGILAIGFGLRVYHLADANLWFDEGFSIWIARDGPLEAARRTLHDTHPPLFYWLLWLWSMPAGPTALAGRFLAVAAGTLAVPLAWQLGRAIGGVRLGLILAALLATSRFAIDWSQQIRMYAPALALVVLVWWLWWRARAGDPAPAGRRWIAFGAATAALGSTLYLALLVPAILILVDLVAGLARRPAPIEWRGRLAGIGVAAVLLAPWIALVAFAGSRPRLTTIAQPDLAIYLEAAATALALGVLGDLGRVKSVALGLIALAGLGYLVAGRCRSSRAAAAAAALGLFGPVALLFALSRPNPILTLPNLFVRYLVVFLPAYLLGIAWLIAGLTRRIAWLAAVLGLGLVLLTGWTLRDYYQGRYLTDDYQTLIETIEAYARPGDRIVLYSDKEYPIFAAHYRGDLPVYRLGTEVKLTEELAAGQGSAAFAGHPNVWVVTVDEGKDADPDGHFRRWLAANTRDLLFQPADNRSVNLYTIDPAERRTAVGTVEPDRRVDRPLSAGWTLAGVDLPLRRVARGDAPRVGIYLEARRAETEVPVVEVDLTDASGTPFRSVRRPLVGSWFPPFAAGQTIFGVVEVRILDGIPGGRYTVRVRLAEPGETTEAVTVGEVAILSDAGPPEQPQPATGRDRPAAAGIALLGHDGPTDPRADAPIEATLYWRTLQATPVELQSYLRLIGLDRPRAPGDPLWAAAFQPAPGGRATTTWTPGLVVRDPIRLDLPPDLPAGRYRLEAGLYDPAAKAEAGEPIAIWEGQLDRR